REAATGFDPNALVVLGDPLIDMGRAASRREVFPWQGIAPPKVETRSGQLEAEDLTEEAAAAVVEGQNNRLLRYRCYFGRQLRGGSCAQRQVDRARQMAGGEFLAIPLVNEDRA